jgi:hypothetical protein
MFSRSPFVSVLLLVLAVVGTALGLCAGILATMQLGIAWHGRYDYFAIGSPVGAVLMAGGAALGAGIPLVLRALWRRAGPASPRAR